VGNIPPGRVGPVGPTGQVHNGSLDPSSFPVIGGNGKSAHFIFANLNGSISAWDAGATAFVQATTPGAIYTGLAINAASIQLIRSQRRGGNRQHRCFQQLLCECDDSRCIRHSGGG